MGEFAGERQSGGILSAREEGQRVGFLFTEIRIGIQIKYRRPIKCRRTCGQRLPIDRAKGPVDLDHDIAAVDLNVVWKTYHHATAKHRGDCQIRAIISSGGLVSGDNSQPEAPPAGPEACGVAGIETGYYTRQLICGEGTTHSREQIQIFQLKGQQGCVIQIGGIVPIQIHIDDPARHGEARRSRNVSEGLNRYIS